MIYGEFVVTVKLNYQKMTGKRGGYIEYKQRISILFSLLVPLNIQRFLGRPCNRIPQADLSPFSILRIYFSKRRIIYWEVLIGRPC